MSRSDRIHIPDSVIHETFEDEAVVVNLRSGAYFSVREPALAIWERIRAGATTGEIDDSSAASADVSILLDVLRSEGLIEAPPDCADGPPLDDRPLADRLGSTIFDGAMEKFTDVEGLLMLDPIHDVASEGWPRPFAERSV